MGPKGAVIGGKTWLERVRHMTSLDELTATFARWKIITGTPFRAIRQEMKRLGYPSLSLADLRWLYHNDERTVRGLLYRQAELPWVLARDLAQAKIDRALKRDGLCKQLCSIERRLKANTESSMNGRERRATNMDPEVPADYIFGEVAADLSTCFKLRELLAMHNQEMQLIDEIRALDIREGVDPKRASAATPQNTAPVKDPWYFITSENHLYEMVRQAHELGTMSKSMTPADKKTAQKLRDRLGQFTLNQVLHYYPSLGFLSEVKLKKMDLHVSLYDRYIQLDRRRAGEYRTLCSLLGLKFPTAPPEFGGTSQISETQG